MAKATMMTTDRPWPRTQAINPGSDQPRICSTHGWTGSAFFSSALAAFFSREAAFASSVLLASLFSATFFSDFVGAGVGSRGGTGTTWAFIDDRLKKTMRTAVASATGSGGRAAMRNFILWPRRRILLETG